MKLFIVFCLLLAQCSSPLEEVQPTSINPEDTGDQIIKLVDLPFDLLAPSDWSLKDTGSELQLWNEGVLQLVITGPSEFLIADGSQVIPSVDNDAITSFCLDDVCLIHMDHEGFFEARALTQAGHAALEHLR